MPWYLNQLGSKGSVEIYWADKDQLPKDISRFDFAPAPDQPPLKMVLKRARKTLPDYFTGPTHSILIVSKAFKDLVETFEPATHHFVPLEIAQPDGTVWKGTHFVFKLGWFVEDGIIVEESEIAVRVYRGGGLPETKSYLPKSQVPRLMWRGSKVRGRHLWADVHLKDANVVSDELYAAIKAHKMTDFRAIESRANDTK